MLDTGAGDRDAVAGAIDTLLDAHLASAKLEALPPALARARRSLGADGVDMLNAMLASIDEAQQ